MKLLELFSGTQSISKVFRANGWDTFTIDFNPTFEKETSWTVNILEVTAQDIIERFGRPHVIWASPPCESFSVAAIGKNWTKEGDIYTPKSQRAEIGLAILAKTLELIEELQPKYFFIENPRGMMRKMPVMQKFERHTVTYCQYGDFRQKPTDLWTNYESPNFKPPCKRGAPCHVAAPRGSSTGTQGIKGKVNRAVIPKELCEHIYSLCAK